MPDNKTRKFKVGEGRSFMLPSVLGRPRRVQSGDEIELDAARCRRGQRVLSHLTRHADLVELLAAPTPPVPPAAPAAPAKV